MKCFCEFRESAIHLTSATFHLDGKSDIIRHHDEIHFIISFAPIIDLVFQLLCHTYKICSDSTLHPSAPYLGILPVLNEGVPLVCGQECVVENLKFGDGVIFARIIIGIFLKST